MSLTIKKITEPLLLGEGPHWDDRQQALFFVDILEYTIHKYVPATGAHTKTKLDGTVGFIVPVDGTTDQFIIGLGTRFVIIQWDGEEGTPAKIVQELGAVDQDVVPENRLNDGKADPRGRIFAGTMGYENPLGNVLPEKGSLYRVDKTGIQKLCSKIGISNGLAWDLKKKACYYTDSLERKIRRYDYDVDTGEISNLKYIFDLEKNNVSGIPDGMTLDSDGNLWVALFNGSSVIKIDPETGKILQTVPIPALQVTSVTFGGPKFDILFVTSARMNIGGAQEPPCGSTFMVTGLGVTGLPSTNFKY
ncbi:unnamed protein product [Euphydryas editha]|uniref:Regucalcin n=1 Tax=Euphydryas editha TaxID=104508 RepID=A0AAU9THU7_EUPED|nr:unnamed protein product [Euphydryas editha]